MKIITGLFISILFLTTVPSFASAASCQCTVRATAVRQACEQISIDECYLKFTQSTVCQPFTDNSCRDAIAEPPPGLSWSKIECATAKGDWLPPASGISNGPYCFEKQDFQTPYKLQIGIAGLTEVKNLGEYISTLYKFSIGLAIFFAIIMTTVAGFLWLTSGGAADKIGRAKKMIFNAVIGIILAAGSYTILQTINPQLLKLQLPRILKIKKVNYVGVKGCNDYSTRADCEHNPIGLNSGIAVFSPVGYSGTGCAWDATSNSCVQKAASVPGQYGGLCIDKTTCLGELKCVFTANIYVCTDGNANSVCGFGPDNNGCQKDLTCDTGLASICYKPGSSQPIGTPCSDNQQCSSKICESKRCTIGQCDPSKCPTGQVCLKNNTQQIETCQNPVKCGTHESCQQTYGATYYCPNKFYDQYTNKLDIQYIESYYGLKNSATAMNCTAGYSGGTICRFNQECASGNCSGLDDTASPLKPGKCN